MTILGDIIADIRQTLSQVTVANGYHTDAGLNLHEFLDGQDARFEEEVGLGLRIEGVERNAQASSYVTAELRFTVHAWAVLEIRSRLSPLPIDALDALATDVQRALTADYQRTGLAHDTIPIRVDFQTDSGSNALAWARIEFSCPFPHDYLDPETYGTPGP